MLCHGGAVEDAVPVGGPLDVAQPAWPVRVAHQVGAECDGVIAGVTCEHHGVMRRLGFKANLGGAVRPGASAMQRAHKPLTGFQQWSTSAPPTQTVWSVLPDLGYGGNSPLKYSLSRTWTKSTPADG